jgi:hypothetical protein
MGGQEVTPLQFAQLWRAEKELLLSSFLEPDSGSQVAAAVTGLALSTDQVQGLRELLNVALTDTMYTLLLGLDGCASIGGEQQCYRVLAESGDELTGEGRLEQAAWEVFHGRSRGTAF